jgi:uncharacterized peroxidase-related enzyme
MAYLPYVGEASTPRMPQGQGSHGPSSPNFLRIHAYDAAIREGVARLHEVMLGEQGALSRRQRLLVAIVVSQINGALYWQQLLGRELLKLGEDARLVVRLQSDFRGADLEPRERTMIEYAAKLTSTPSDITAADLRLLRDAGFSNAAIHCLCTVAGYFTFINRITSGLGVETDGGREG